jgi:acyl carrier protein
MSAIAQIAATLMQHTESSHAHASRSPEPDAPTRKLQTASLASLSSLAPQPAQPAPAHRRAPHIKQKVREYIDDNFLMGSQARAYADDDSFLDRQLIDSTGYLELVSFLEGECGVRIDEDEMLPENLDSLDGIEAFMERKLAL